MKSDRGGGNHWADSPQRHLTPLQEYRQTVLSLFPGREKWVLDSCPFSTADALFLGCFLDCYSQKVVALEVSACAGAPAFWLASHRNVSSVMSVNPNPPVSQVLMEQPLRRSLEERYQGDLRVLGIARAALEEHPEKREKISFLEGRVNELRPEAVRLPEDEDPVALVNDSGSTKEVIEDLSAVFDSNPRAVVFLANCRRERGLFVQAGVAEFFGSSRIDYRFRLAADLGPAFAGSGVGVVYAGAVATEVERTLEEVDRLFSRKLDPLRLLAREEELMDVVRKLNQQASEAGGKPEHTDVEREARHDGPGERRKKRDTQLRNKIARLETRIANLEAHNAELRSRFSSRRYRLADALAEKVLRLSALRRFMHRKGIPPSGGA